MNSQKFNTPADSLTISPPPSGQPLRNGQQRSKHTDNITGCFMKGRAIRDGCGTARRLGTADHLRGRLISKTRNLYIKADAAASREDLDNQLLGSLGGVVLKTFQSKSIIGGSIGSTFCEDATVSDSFITTQIAKE